METSIGTVLRGSKKFFIFRFIKAQGSVTRQFGWMLVATVATGAFNYLANISVGRLLGPADYSVYATMLSLTLVLGAVTSIIQTIVSNFVTQLRSSAKEAEISPLILTLTKRLLAYSLFGMLIIWVLSQPLANILQLSSPQPVIIMAVTLIPCAILPIFQGVARGMERYFMFGVTQIGMAVLRLFIGVLLINLGMGVTGAVASLPLYFILALFISILGIYDLVKFRSASFNYAMPEIMKHLLYVSAGMVAYTVLTNIDVSIVKSRFLAEQAGLYSAIATTGKITLYLPSAVATLLLPKVALRNACGGKTLQMLWKALLIVSGICGSIALAFFIFPNLVVHTLFGDQYLPEAGLLGPYGTAMMLYAMCNILLAYSLALHKKFFSYFLFFMAIVQTVLLIVLKLSLIQVVDVMILCGLVANIGAIFLIF